MRFLGLFALAALLAGHIAPASAQLVSAGEPRIVWEVKNRFRLFREEKDFLQHVDATARTRTLVEAEQVLARESDGRGWARNTVNRLCIDAAGRIIDPCPRDGAPESYLSPADHSVGIRVEGAAGATCSWLFDQGVDAKGGFLPCEDEIRLRVPSNRTTIVTADVRQADGSIMRVSAEIAVRDLLIAGLGDSIAAGEGNPDRPVALADDGFCFRQFIGTGRSEYFRPGRAGFKGDRSCEMTRSGPEVGDAWNKLSARWQNNACHRSLYGYQARTALALAVEQPHIAVTFLPLACTGSTIEAGLMGTRPPREVDCGGSRCANPVPAQIPLLTALLTQARKHDPNRTLDLVLLTIGANDIDFSGLVADVIIEEPWSRALFKRGGVLGSVTNSQWLLEQKLPQNFLKLRAALKPLVGDLSHVVFTSYANPVLTAEGASCAGGRDGFDVHPAFSANAQRLRAASEFVETRFLPALKALAVCSAGTVCGAREAMTFVDAHQEAFAGHGLCARALSDPAFDNECFSPEGATFTQSAAEGATNPLACGQRPSAFRAYASRMRWIRTANDSYFAAMTYPQGMTGSMQPTDIHDAMWGVLSTVYGGAVHPTAEGHAAMADAALVDARRVVRLALPQAAVLESPLPAPVQQ
jgi:lysophospholipase L1-like esterase